MSAPEPEDLQFSTNERAERLMGRRLTAEEEAVGIVAFDMPCELGYWCPVHRRHWDENLDWSEYHGFLWCAECNRDYPTPLCVSMEAPEGEASEWYRTGPEAAVDIFLDVLESAVARRVGAKDGPSDVGEEPQ